MTDGVVPEEDYVFATRKGEVVVARVNQTMLKEFRSNGSTSSGGFGGGPSLLDILVLSSLGSGNRGGFGGSSGGGFGGGGFGGGFGGGGFSGGGSSGSW